MWQLSQRPRWPCGLSNRSKTSAVAKAGWQRGSSSGGSPGPVRTWRESPAGQPEAGSGEPRVSPRSAPCYSRRGSPAGPPPSSPPSPLLSPAPLPPLPPRPPPGAGRGSGDGGLRGDGPEGRSARSSAPSLLGAALRTPTGPGSPASAQPPSWVRPPQPRVTLVLLTAGDGRPCHWSRARWGGVGGVHATPRRGFPSTPDRGAVGNTGPNWGLSPNDRGL